MTIAGLGGRKKIVDVKKPAIRKQVEIFGRLCATHEEMADFFDCSLSTIEKYMAKKDEDKGEKPSEFLRVYKKASGKAKVSLRRKQLSKAMGGDNILLIWLGKQLLGQRDKHETETTIKRKTISDEPLTPEEWEAQHGENARLD